jgi:hypothetical protein
MCVDPSHLQGLAEVQHTLLLVKRNIHRYKVLSRYNAIFFQVLYVLTKLALGVGYGEMAPSSPKGSP